MIIQAIRSLVFYLLFLGQTVVLAILLGVVALFIPRGHPAPRFMWAVGRYWGHFWRDVMQSAGEGMGEGPTAPHPFAKAEINAPGTGPSTSDVPAIDARQSTQKEKN